MDKMDHLDSIAITKITNLLHHKTKRRENNALIREIIELNFDTYKEMEEIANLIYEIAVDEPDLSFECAVLCRLPSIMRVSGDLIDNTSDFRTLLVNRCQKEFQIGSSISILRNKKFMEIEECSILEKKKELFAHFKEKEKIMLKKALGNIRFIGELFKQGILTKKTIHSNIKHLLQQGDEENLECLCKLLMTLGTNFDDIMNTKFYYEQIQNMANNRKINFEVRFLLQEVVNLRPNNTLEDNNETSELRQNITEKPPPVTFNHVPKGPQLVEYSYQDDQWSPINKEGKKIYDRDFLMKLSEDPNSKIKPLNLPDLDVVLKDNSKIRQHSSRARSPEMRSFKEHNMRGHDNLLPGSAKSPMNINRAVGRARLLPSMNNLQLGKRNSYIWNKNVSMHAGLKTVTPNKSTCFSSKECFVLDSARSQSISMTPQSKPATQPTSISNKPEKSEDEIIKFVRLLVEEYISVDNKDDVALEIKKNIPPSQLPMLVREIINAVLEKSTVSLESISKLFSFLITHKSITLNDFRKGLNEILDLVDDLIIDIPKIWTYIAEILVYLLIEGSHPISELPITLADLRCKGQTGNFVGELLFKMAKICGQVTLTDKWSQSRLQLSDVINGERENIEEIIQNYRLQFLFED